MVHSDFTVKSAPLYNYSALNNYTEAACLKQSDNAIAIITVIFQVQVLQKIFEIHKYLKQFSKLRISYMSSILPSCCNST